MSGTTARRRRLATLVLLQDPGQTMPNAVPNAHRRSSMIASSYSSCVLTRDHGINNSQIPVWYVLKDGGKTPQKAARYCD